MWQATLPAIAAVEGISYSLTIQPITPSVTSKSAPDGGNSLGLDPSDGVLVVCELAVAYKLKSDDGLITTTAEKLFADIDTEAKKKRLFSGFIYLNYAAKNQKPISSSGSASVQRLRDARRRYDPKGVFQKQVPGRFKLFTEKDIAPAAIPATF